MTKCIKQKVLYSLGDYQKTTFTAKFIILQNHYYGNCNLVKAKKIERRTKNI